MAELFFDVPVDYSKPNEGSLRLFARSVRRVSTPVEPGNNGDNKQLPWLVYLQGGPGMGCRAPQDYGWVGTVLDKGYQVCFLMHWRRKTSKSSIFVQMAQCLQSHLSRCCS